MLRLYIWGTVATLVGILLTLMVLVGSGLVGIPKQGVGSKGAEAGSKGTDAGSAATIGQSEGTVAACSASGIIIGSSSAPSLGTVHSGRTMFVPTDGKKFTSPKMSALTGHMPQISKAFTALPTVAHFLYAFPNNAAP